MQSDPYRIMRRAARKHGLSPDELDFWHPALRTTGDWLAVRQPGFTRLLARLRGRPGYESARARFSFIDACHPARVLPLP
jgi:hypothetical protein